MAFDKKLLNIVACPLCKGKLVLVQNVRQDVKALSTETAGEEADAILPSATQKAVQELVCKFDRLAFPIKDNIPVLLENEARELSLEELETIKS